MGVISYDGAIFGIDKPTRISGPATTAAVGTANILQLYRDLTSGVSQNQYASFNLGRYAAPGGSFEGFTRLDFALSANVPAFTSEITIMTLQNNGNVGIGTVGPNDLLQLQSTSDTAYDPTSDTGQYGSGTGITITNMDTATQSFSQVNMQVSSSSGRALGRIVTICMGSATSDMAFVTENMNVKTEKMRIAANGNIKFNTYTAGALTSDANGNITSVSDERLKTIDGNFSAGLNEVLQIKPILYHWNESSQLDTENMYAGFSAQNIQSVIPIATMAQKDTGYLSIQDRPIIAALVNSIKELEARIKILELK